MKWRCRDTSECHTRQCTTTTTTPSVASGLRATGSGSSRPKTGRHGDSTTLFRGGYCHRHAMLTTPQYRSIRKTPTPAARARRRWHLPPGAKRERGLRNGTLSCVGTCREEQNREDSVVRRRRGHQRQSNDCNPSDSAQLIVVLCCRRGRGQVRRHIYETYMRPWGAPHVHISADGAHSDGGSTTRQSAPVIRHDSGGDVAVCRRRATGGHRTRVSHDLGDAQAARKQLGPLARADTCMARRGGVRDGDATDGADEVGYRRPQDTDRSSGDVDNESDDMDTTTTVSMTTTSPTMTTTTSTTMTTQPPRSFVGKAPLVAYLPRGRGAGLATPQV